MSAENLRLRLRDGCADLHDRLDGAVARMDVREVAGLRGFLAMNAAAFGALACGGAKGVHVGTATIAGLAEAATRDLVSLGAAPGRVAPVMADPLAVDYVVLGSRMGTRVLRRRWQGARNSSVLQADRYFSQPDMAPEWRALCDDLSARPGDDARARVVLADARALFTLFLDAQASTEETLANA